MVGNSSKSAPFFIHIPNMHETYQEKYQILPIILPSESAGPYMYLKLVDMYIYLRCFKSSLLLSDG